MIDFPTTFDTNLVMYSALLGSVIPALIAAINRSTWQPEQKGLMALLLCVVAAIPVAAFLGKLDTANWVTSALIVFTLSQVLYKTFWQPSGIAPVIEEITG